MTTCPIKPKNADRENAFDCGSILRGRNSQQRPRARPFVHLPADMQPGERMLEVRRYGERIDDRVGKPLAKQAMKSRAELFPGNPTGRAARIGAQKFKPARFRAPESSDLQDDLIFAALFHAQDAAR